MPTAGAPPNSWCCVRDLSPELVVYMRGTPQGRPLPTAVRAEGIPGAPQAEAKVLQVRIVTEKDGAGWGRGFLELWKSVILCVCLFSGCWSEAQFVGFLRMVIVFDVL